MSAEQFNKRGKSYLSEHLGITAVEIRQGYSELRLPIAQHLMAANGYLHAGSVVTLADSACGMGCMASLPEGANSFTTIELKSNFLGTCLEGAIIAKATLLHGGRSTQVWDATVTREADDKAIAHFRCTQMILYPR